MNIKIIYEDDYLLAIDKPSGITVNRSDTTKEEETVQDWAEEKLNARGPAARHARHLDGAHSPVGDLRAIKASDSRHPSQEEEFIHRAGIVHRLDKETSGILLIAKTPEVFVDLQRQFKERKVEKTYIALVHGKVVPDEGEINVPVGRLSFNRKRFGVVAGGREASTQYKVLSIKYLGKESLSLLELYPKTGRTHQIRVHLKYFNHPVFSDNFYAGRKTARSDRKVLPRLFLHASEIYFTHPTDGKLMSFKSLLPQELGNFLSKLSEVSI